MAQSLETAMSGPEQQENVLQCHLQWTSIRKSVHVPEATSGLLRSSIVTPTMATKEMFQKTGPTNKAIVNNVSGSAAPGEILALMGPSGSGKTSLLNILSGRSVFDSGKIYINSIHATGTVLKRLRHKIAYVKQTDLFFNHLTVREQLTYTALLRLPGKDKHEKHYEVDEIISLLRLSKCADTPIRLISGGEKKRVNIGTELLTDPLVIMLDEPTSGLDSTSAVALIDILHDFAKSGKTIVTSIHQPSSAVFKSFDKLCMLADGHCAYFGTPVGSLGYLENLGLACPPGYNIADHWMDLLVVEEGTKNEVVKGSETTSRNSELSLCSSGRSTQSRLIVEWSSESECMEEAVSEKTTEDNNCLIDSFGKKYNVSWLNQLLVLTHRSLKNSSCAIFTPLKITQSAVIGFIMGLLWFQIPYTEANVNDYVGYYFFTILFWVFNAMNQSLMSFPLERTIIYKERESGSYHLSAYFIAKTLSDVPNRLALPIIYMIISYWMAGINPRFVVFLATTMCTLLGVMVGESYGLIVGANIMDIQKGRAVMIVTSLTLMAVSGYFVQNVPAFMSWMKYFSPFKYAFDACQQIVFDRPVPCDGSEVLPQCQGTNVGSVTPEEILDFLNVQGSIGFNITMLLVLFAIPRYIAFLLLKKNKENER